MKAFRVEYFVPVVGYPGGGIKRSKKVMANDHDGAIRSFITTNSSARITKIYEDNCKNCKNK